MQSVTSSQVRSGVNYFRIGLFLLAITWIGAGIQHLMYMTFMSTMVPQYMPLRMFWVGFTGVAMILAGISFLFRFKVSSSALMLSIMLLIFILMLHVPKLLSDSRSMIDFTRTVQDIAIMAGLMLIASPVLVNISQYIYALMLLILGSEHFVHAEFITAKIPAYFPATNLFDYIIGAFLILAAIGIMINSFTILSARFAGILLLLFALLYNGQLLIQHVYDPTQWTTFFLDLAVAAGAFIIADKLIPIVKLTPIP